MIAQNFDPPPPKTPDEATLKLIAEKKAALDKAIAEAIKKLPAEHQADLLIYPKAVEWITRHREYYTADIGKQILAVIDQGMKRADQAKDGKPVWLMNVAGTSVVRGYRSVIDGSIQPYAVWFPSWFGDEDKGKRIDVSLHGRDGSLTEVKFISSHAGRSTPKDNGFVQIDIYGRGNNAYRWAGEEDVDDALNNYVTTELTLGRQANLSTEYVVLKGFSMGGAGTWHLGLRRPSEYIALQPGAGFTTTHGYIAGLPAVLPAPQEELLTIYDATRYARNAAMVPVVAYSGELDKQRQAAVNIEDRLRALGLLDRMSHLVGPGLDHKFPPEWQLKAEAKLKELTGKKPAQTPEWVEFTTYTLRTPWAGWARIEGMGRHYSEATVSGQWMKQSLTVKTKNVRRLRVSRDPFAVQDFPAFATIDGQQVSCAVDEPKPALGRLFAFPDGKWSLSSKSVPKELEKRPNLQGPIDDAFTRPFVCVVGTGTPANAAMQAAASAQLDRFKREWDKWFRGDLKVMKDTELASSKFGPSNIVLFGDPGSNSAIAELLPKLPIKWTAKELVVNGVTYPADSHLPMLVFPHPNRPGVYVVINSGHTFHDAEFKGTNAQLYPRLGDYAVVKPAPTAKEPAAFEVVENGLFDESWKFSKK